MKHYLTLSRGGSELTIPQGGAKTPALHIRAIFRSFQVGLDNDAPCRKKDFAKTLKIG